MHCAPSNLAVDERAPGAGPGRALCALAVAALLLGSVQGAAAEPAVTIDAVRHGAVVQLTARAVLRAPAGVVWDTLTDYDHLWKFIPGLRSSRVLARRGATAIVEETGEARYWLLSFPIHVVLASTEHPPDRIDARVVSGNLAKLDGSYRIAPGANGTLVLTWSGSIEPAFWLPSFVVEALVRSSVAEQFRGLVQEIERRASAQR
jgi:ribosome-associated toxin RatA of RatAB toxin-antitoxin module